MACVNAWYIKTVRKLNKKIKNRRRTKLLTQQIRERMSGDEVGEVFKPTSYRVIFTSLEKVK